MEIADLIGIPVPQGPGTRPPPRLEDRFERHLTVRDPANERDSGAMLVRDDAAPHPSDEVGLGDDIAWRDSRSDDDTRPDADMRAPARLAPHREPRALNPDDSKPRGERVGPAADATDRDTPAAPSGSDEGAPNDPAVAATAAKDAKNAAKPAAATPINSTDTAAEGQVAAPAVPTELVAAAPGQPQLAVSDAAATVAANPSVVAAQQSPDGAAPQADAAGVLAQATPVVAQAPVAEVAVEQVAGDVPAATTTVQPHAHARGDAAKAPKLAATAPKGSPTPADTDKALAPEQILAALSANSVAKDPLHVVGGHHTVPADSAAPSLTIQPVVAGDPARGTTTPTAPAGNQPAHAPAAANAAGQGAGQNGNGQGNGGNAGTQAPAQLLAAATADVSGRRPEFRLPDTQSLPQVSGTLSASAGRPDLGTMTTPTFAPTAAGNAAATNPAAAMARPTLPQPAFLPPAPMVQVAMNIADAVEDGSSRIGIRLQPEEMGRVDVRLNIGRDGRVSAVVLADRADTLALLKSDIQGLERALSDAGLRAETGGLSFGLRERGEGGFGREQQSGKGRAQAIADAALAAASEPIRGFGSRALDISV